MQLLQSIRLSFVSQRGHHVALRPQAEQVSCVQQRAPSTLLCQSAWMIGLGLMLSLVMGLGSLRAADLDEAQSLFHHGEYDKCIEMTRAEVDRGIWHDGWSKLLMRALMAKGQYDEAATVYTKVAEKFSASMSLRLLAVEALRHSGKQAEARALLTEIPTLLKNAPWRYSDRDNMIALGQYFLNEGEDAREVLDLFYDRTLKSDSKYIEAYLAIAELALGKNDYQEAVNSLTKAEKLASEDPRIHYLLARAWAPSDNKKSTEYLKKALTINPRHADSLLLQCESLLDAEQFDDADELIGEVLKLNARHPKAWALRAVIKHLRGEYREEGECRKMALSTWAQNPLVDYEIGRKLSRFYRFADAVQYLRRAISLDANYLPARFQLAQDLLRLNATDEGWTMVDQVSAADKYNVVASNLKTLRDRLSKFVTLECEGFIVRMDQREARVYGPRVLDLLSRARETLCKKYEYELKEPVHVEIFPQQSDFAIRTFGLPGGAGFLGVCFGKLITANSPASQGESPSNWESVLWHEFCHVVTLQKSNNRMPRWLSEGISVYEELEQNGSWGQSMNPTYRQMIMGDEFVPLSELSGAFLHPPSPMHLQFAYFESSLAVRYMVERHGLERLKKLLVDLGMGIPMQDALSRIYGETAALDADFKEYALAAAKKLFTEEIDEEAELPKRPTTQQLQEFVAEHPRHYTATRLLAQRALAEGKLDQALELMTGLDKLWPADAESGGILESLALVYRKLEQPALERTTLERIVERSSDNLSAISRLIELSREAKDWQAVRRYAQMLLAVQPLISLGHTALAEAGEALGKPEIEATAYASLLELQPLDAGRLHYQLAKAQFDMHDLTAARQHVLVALEETPRYRAAQKLLTAIVAQRDAVQNNTPPNNTTPSNTTESNATKPESRTIALPDSVDPPAPETSADLRKSQ